MKYGFRTERKIGNKIGKILLTGELKLAVSFGEQYL
jgi:hypothetical protein